MFPISNLITFSLRLLLILSIFYDYNGTAVIGQSILDRFRPNSNISAVDTDQVKVISGSKVKRYERLTIPIGGTGGSGGGVGGGILSGIGIGAGAGAAYNLLQPNPSYVGLAYVRNPPVVIFPRLGRLFDYGPHWPIYPVRVAPHWQAGAKLTGEGIEGLMTFQQLPYNNDIKVTLNATGVPAGKHALHIHTYGDLTDGCKSTGGQFANNFLGNIDVKEDGVVSVAFVSIYLNLFGYNGIIGRSVIIHEKPIDLNSALNAEVFSSPLHAIPDAQAYQNEENSVGASIACGIISIMKVPVATINK